MRKTLSDIIGPILHILLRISIMGNRLSKIVTRTGDAGLQDLATDRESPRIRAALT